MSWVKVRDFDETLEEFKSKIEKAKEISELDYLDSGWLWWDEKHNQYVFLRVIVTDAENEEGELHWCGNGLTAYEGYIEFKYKEGLLDILDNIDEHFDIES